MGVQGIVQAFSTACGTPLSNFEAGLNYKGRSRSGRGGELSDEGGRGRELRGVDDDSLDFAQQHFAVRSSHHGIH